MPVLLHINIAVSLGINDLPFRNITVDNIFFQDVKKVLNFSNSAERRALNVDLLVEVDSSQSEMTVGIDESRQHGSAV